MQNVLLQMGLHLVSVDGMLIRRTNTYVLRCHACFKYTILNFIFCGNVWFSAIDLAFDIIRLANVFSFLFRFANNYFSFKFSKIFSIVFTLYRCQIGARIFTFYNYGFS